MVTFKQTLHNIRADFRRRLLLENKTHGLLNKLFVLIHPCMVSVIMYRLSRFCIYNRLGLMYRFLVIIEHMYARNEISPRADIGPGLVLNGISIGIPCATVIGKNCTFLGRNTLTLGGMEGYDLETDRFLIGDHCVFGVGSRVIRPVKLESGTQIMPNAIVVLAENKVGSTVSGIPARRRRTDALESIINWNPLTGNFLQEQANT